MSVIDDKINSLSSEELDLLNSDPKLLEDFKAKYTTPSPVPSETNQVLGAVGSTLKSTLLPDVSTATQPLSGGLKEQLQQSLEPISGLARMGQTLREPSIKAGEAVEQFGKDINAPLTGKLGGFITQTALDPVTYAGMMTNFIPEDIAAQGPKLMEKATNIPAKATELGGYKQPIPTQQEIDKAIQNVQNTVKKVWQEHGNLLNKAKVNAGIPSTEDEIAASVRKYGNPSNLDIARPLALPDQPLAQTKTFEGPSFLDKYGSHTHMKDQLEKWAVEYRDNPELAKQSIDNVVATNTATGERKIGAWFKTPEIANQFKQEVISKLEKGEGASQFTMSESKSQLPMQYKIGEHDDPRQLMTEINRFKANIPYIDKKDQVKAAHYFQDQITQQGVFKQDVTKGVVNGTLKSQYGDLSNIIQESSPELKAAKSKMADLYDTMDDINKKISGGPGEAEAYLRKLFTSKSPEIKDDLKALAKIEALSGQPVIKTLFEKFAGEAYGQLLGESIHTVFQAPYAALTSPRVFMRPLMKYGPGAAKYIAKPAVMGVTERGIQQPFNTPDMQSLKDRLQNAQ